jgi:hypothetical protein
MLEMSNWQTTNRFIHHNVIMCGGSRLSKPATQNIRTNKTQLQALLYTHYEIQHSFKHYSTPTIRYITATSTTPHPLWDTTQLQALLHTHYEIQHSYKHYSTPTMRYNTATSTTPTIHDIRITHNYTLHAQWDIPHAELQTTLVLQEGGQLGLPPWD